MATQKPDPKTPEEKKNTKATAPRGDKAAAQDKPVRTPTQPRPGTVSNTPKAASADKQAAPSSAAKKAEEPKDTAPRKAPQKDPEAARRKKEEAARKSRRRSRQWIGFALAVLILVGAFSIVLSGVNLVRSLMDNTAEKDKYATLLRPFVWFDTLPFEQPLQLGEDTLKQVIIWSVMYQMGTEVPRDAEENAVISTLDIDQYATGLFGPDFRFSSHASFEDRTQGIFYRYDETANAYIVPGTGLEPNYDSVIVDIVQEDNGVRRVIVGYVSLRANDGAIVPTTDYDNPVRYMDYMFQRDGNSYYLFALRINSTYQPTQTGTPSSSQNTGDFYPEDELGDEFEDFSAITSTPSGSTEPASTPQSTDEGNPESNAEPEDDTSADDSLSSAA